MATLEKNLEIANLVCKFGDHNLLDLYKEVVEPSFFKNKIEKLAKVISILMKYHWSI